jgi:hypothetical protein
LVLRLLHHLRLLLRVHSLVGLLLLRGHSLVGLLAHQLGMLVSHARMSHHSRMGYSSHPRLSVTRHHSLLVTVVAAVHSWMVHSRLCHALLILGHHARIGTPGDAHWHGTRWQAHSIPWSSHAMRRWTNSHWTVSTRGTTPADSLLLLLLLLLIPLLR